MSKSRASKTKAAGSLVNGSKYIPGYRRRRKKESPDVDASGDSDK